MDLELREEPPTAEDFMRLRDIVGWGSPDRATVEASLERALYSACLYRGGELVGMARVIGDGAMYFSIHDVIVVPELQGRGLGARLMDAVMAYLAAVPPGATIGLMAAIDKQDFYLRYGFLERPNPMLGPGMSLFIPGKTA